MEHNFASPQIFEKIPELHIEKVLNGVSQVIMCLDQQDPSFVKQIIRRGVDYIDITAASNFIAVVEKFDDQAKVTGSSVVLSVGLEPGLTNLLAADAKTALDEIKHLDIFVLLGMGDTHGDAAIQWTLENINAEFSVLEHGQEKKVRSFEGGKRTLFPGIGERTAYHFNFPDQHSLPRTLGIDSVASRLCFDIEIMTNIIAMLKRAGVLQILNNAWAKQLFIKGLKNLHLGSDQFALKTVAIGKKNGNEVKVSSTARGTGEAHLTGLVAAQVAKNLYTGNYAPGIFHIDQLFELEPLLNHLIEIGLLEITREIL